MVWGLWCVLHNTPSSLRRQVVSKHMIISALKYLKVHTEIKALSSFPSVQVKLTIDN